MAMPQYFFADLVREASFDVGAGSLVLAGALAGHRGFAGTVPVGALFCYAIAGAAVAGEWETGSGRIAADGRLERVSVAASSNGGAAVAFSAGLKTVALTVGAGWYAAVSQPPELADVAGLTAALDGKQSIGVPQLVLRDTSGTVREASLSVDAAGNVLLRGNPSAGAMTFDSPNGTHVFRNTSNGKTVLTFSVWGIGPGSDNVRTLGTADMRFATLFAASGTINTSDAAAKKQIGRVPDRWLDAWGDVDWCRYRFRGGKRWHVGLVAQRVAAAFAARGIDANGIGLLCRDALPDGSERWGLRYDECQALEAAWVRRELARLRAGGAR